MPGNSFGNLFRISTFGESHGEAVGVVIDGCPSNIPISLDFVNAELTRRKPGQSHITTQRKEPDVAELLSGVFEGKSTGAPMAFLVRNTNQKSQDYEHLKDAYRPSHADFTYQQKYGHRDYRGGGRSSARETLARVIGGAVAKQFLQQLGITIAAYVSQVGSLKLETPYTALDLGKTEDNIVRCPDAGMAEQMIALIEQVRKQGDTIGGTITAVIKGVPVGLGEPAFDKLHADLGKAMLSINAAKGFDYGSGFNGITLKGSEHNDIFFNEEGKVATRTNLSGGIQGGISNGQDIYFRTAFKPVATIMQQQPSVNTKGEEIALAARGRHDPCVLPRAVPIVEAMAALVIIDHYLIMKAYSN